MRREDFIFKYKLDKGNFVLRNNKSLFMSDLKLELLSCCAFYEAHRKYQNFNAALVSVKKLFGSIFGQSEQYLGYWSEFAEKFAIPHAKKILGDEEYHKYLDALEKEKKRYEEQKRKEEEEEEELNGFWDSVHHGRNHFDFGQALKEAFKQFGWGDYEGYRRQQQSRPHQQNNTATASTYKTLGLDNTATVEEIKGAYRTLSKKYHPDMPDGDESKFIEINEAYEQLKTVLKFK